MTPKQIAYSINATAALVAEFVAAHGIKAAHRQIGKALGLPPIIASVTVNMLANHHWVILPYALPVREDFGPTDYDDTDRAAMRASLHQAIDEVPLSADDLRFILVLVTMAWGTPPAALYARLRSDVAAAAGSSPADPVPPAGAPAVASPMATVACVSASRAPVSAIRSATRSILFLSIPLHSLQ